MKIIAYSFFALIAFANASKLDSILQSKEQAASKLRARRGLGDPDEWCGNTLKNPSCWEEFAETVWKPTKIFGSLVNKKEGWPLYWCVKKCNTGDFWKDFIGSAHEEKREKREEYCETMGENSDGCDQPEVGCPQCCDKIPKQLLCLQKIKQACPEQWEDQCGDNNSDDDYEEEDDYSQESEEIGDYE